MANKRSLNRVILIGTVGRDPEITHIPSIDRDVAKFSLATTEVWMDKNSNQFQESTEWHNIVAWGPTAKKIERGVSKGTLVLVEGKLKTRKWKDQNDQERRTTDIQADSVVVLEKSAREREASSYGKNSGSGGYSKESHDYSYPNSGSQVPPEMQYDDINDIPYDNGDPF
ncbi:MAG: single-stranded DNA-binding protein [Candidatus Omnitrophota bacterium]